VSGRETSAGGTLGDLLRARGVAVRDAPEKPAAAPDALDLGGAPKLVLRREKKGRGGKTATVIEGLRLPPSALERIARELKRALGCGASTEGATIVVQGDMAARIEPWLAARGAKKIVVGN
jgi:translation initiation factor 1